MTDLDRRDLVDRLGGDGGLADELLAIFSEELPSLVSAVHRAHVAGDGEALARAGHDLKGAAANVGALAVRQLAEGLEELGRDGRVENGSVSLAKLDRAAKRFQDLVGSNA